MKGKKHPYVAYIILVLVVGVTFWFSSQKGMNSHDMSIGICERIVAFVDRGAGLGLDEKQYFSFVRFLDTPVRKAAHMAEYAVLGVVLYVIVSAYTGSGWKRVMFVMGMLALAGSLDEVHQLYVTAREGKWQDVVVDVIGGSVGMIVAMRERRGGEQMWIKDEF